MPEAGFTRADPNHSGRTLILSYYKGKIHFPLCLSVKLTQMLYVPWVGQRYSIFCGEANASGPAYLCNLEGPLPAGGEFVEPCSVQDPPQDEVASLELPIVYEPLMIAPSSSVHFGLLLATFVRQRSPHRHAAAVPAWIRQKPGPMVSPGEFPGKACFSPVDQEEWSLLGGSAACGPIAP